MTRRFTLQIVALLMLAVVAFVFVAPLIDLEPTALRAWQAARLLLAAVASFAFSFAGCSTGLHSSPRGFPNVQRVPDSLQDLTCVRLC